MTQWKQGTVYFQIKPTAGTIYVDSQICWNTDKFIEKMQRDAKASRDDDKNKDKAFTFAVISETEYRQRKAGARA